MGRVGYVYVSRAASGNWDTGLAGGVWGWETSVLDRKLGRAAAASLRTGDVLVLARGGPNARTPPGSWRDVHLAEAWVASVVRPLYTSAKEVWPDKPYPHRVDLTELTRFSDVTAEELGGPEAMECLRLSANKQGAPVPAYLDLTEPSPLDTDDVVPDMPPNRLAMVVQRAEQGKLRKLKFGDSPTATCELCGRVFPRRLVRAAHIKRRAVLDPGEHWNLENIMAACAFGCDEMFEHGYVYVDETGRVKPHSRVTSGSSLEEFFVNYLADHICRAYNDNSATRLPQFVATRR